MKAALIGVGQAGGKLTQALAEYDARTGHGAVRGAFAVNTARADLQSLDVPTLLVGQERVKGHGVGGDNELGAELMRSDVTQVMGQLDGIVDAETEAIFVVAGLGGGTGSGGAPVLVHSLQAVYERPVYVVGVLPGGGEGAMYQANAGRSLKTVVREADATLLIDNDAWHASGESVEAAYDAINRRIAQRLGLLLAAGEAVEGVGESVVDSSEIINTLRGGGMAALGYASAAAAPESGENVNVVTSITRKALLTGMSVPDSAKAESALLVVAGDPDRIPRKGVERARRWVEETTESLEVRGGDFPLGSESVAALVLLSGIERSGRIDQFMERAREANRVIKEEREAELFQNDQLDGLF